MAQKMMQQRPILREGKIVSVSEAKGENKKREKDEPDELRDLGGEGGEESTERSSSRSDVRPVEAD